MVRLQIWKAFSHSGYPVFVTRLFAVIDETAFGSEVIIPCYGNKPVLVFTPDARRVKQQRNSVFRHIINKGVYSYGNDNDTEDTRRTRRS